LIQYHRCTQRAVNNCERRRYFKEYISHQILCSLIVQYSFNGFPGIILMVAFKSIIIWSNSIRPLAVRRKNYLFCGNHDAAENAAIIYSLLGCCSASHVNPREWLIDMLTRIPKFTTILALIWQNSCHITGKLFNLHKKLH
jgi:hypothetical protein